MHKIQGKCRTNLDNYDCPVTVFTRCPNIGERVMVTLRGNTTSLKIVGITHSVKDDEPFILVELHN